jgi:hypothetical protein
MVVAYDAGVVRVLKPVLVAAWLCHQVLQARYKDVWIEQATRVFSELDTDGSGTVSGAEIANMLREKLQDEDVEVSAVGGDSSAAYLGI